MDEDLEARLKANARAFEGLVSLIPADRYYGKDNTDQWLRKKQTPEERAKARRAKLDPKNIKSAKDVMDENDRKRKRETNGDHVRSVEDASEDAEVEQPGQGLKRPAKKAKKHISESLHEEGDTLSKSKTERLKEKRERKKEKIIKAKEKSEAKAEAKRLRDTENADSAEPATESTEFKQDEELEGLEMDKVDVTGLIPNERFPPANGSPEASPPPDSTFSHNSDEPAVSSTSSIVAPAGTESENPTKITLPKVDHEILKARLQARIDALRAARKADGINGNPARSRQELIDSRRRKEELRKQHKKELRKQAKEEEEEQSQTAAEAELAQLRGNGSPLAGSDVFSPAPTENLNTSFAFGRIAFDDGERIDSNGQLAEKARTKGASDPRTALQAAERKRARLNGLDEAKRKQIESKDLWLKAKKRVHGERVRDDISLLKKTLKRKEKIKAKSEREWKEREDGVRKSQEARQRKREDNLAKRREEKGKKGSAKGPKGPKTKKKKKSRPGFEGSFRGKAK